MKFLLLILPLLFASKSFTANPDEVCIPGEIFDENKRVCVSTDTLQRFLPGTLAADLRNSKFVMMTGVAKAGQFRLETNKSGLVLTATNPPLQSQISNTEEGQKAVVMLSEKQRLSVSLENCTESKGFKCLSTYNDQTQRFVLNYFTPTNGQKSPSALECDVATGQKNTYLHNCLSFSASTCDLWHQNMKNSKEYQNIQNSLKDMAKCADILGDMRAVDKSIGSIFKPNQESAREAQESFNRARSDRGIPVFGHLKPDVRTFKDSYLSAFSRKTEAINLVEKYCGENANSMAASIQRK